MASRSAESEGLESGSGNGFRHWHGIGTVLVVAALLRLLSIAVLRRFLHPNTWEFGPIARTISAGLGYTILLPNGARVPSAFEPPAYPYILAIFYRLGGEGPLTYLAIELLQAAFGVLLVYLVYRLAAILLNERGAIAAAILAAIFPAQIYMCNEFHSISIYIVLEVAVVLFLVRHLEITHSWKDLIGSGICMGLTMLFRGEAPALALLYACILVMRGGWRSAKQAILFILIAFACLAPWTIRNTLAFGKIVPICTTTGTSLYIGHNPLATGGDRYAFFGPPVPPNVKHDLDQLPFDHRYEAARSDALNRIAIKYIRTHPIREVELAFKKLFIFFFFDPDHEKGRLPAYWLPSVLLTLCAIYGAVLRRKKLFREDLPLTTTVLMAIAVGMAVLVLPRYKIVIDPFLMIFAAAIIAHDCPKKTCIFNPMVC